jgi:hypothetical protein
MKQIQTVNYVYNENGSDVRHAIVKYTDGTIETVSSKNQLIEIQNQLKFQAKQVLME